MVGDKVCWLVSSILGSKGKYSVYTLAEKTATNCHSMFLKNVKSITICEVTAGTNRPHFWPQQS